MVIQRYDPIPVRKRQVQSVNNIKTAVSAKAIKSFGLISFATVPTKILFGD